MLRDDASERPSSRATAVSANTSARLSYLINYHPFTDCSHNLATLVTTIHSRTAATISASEELCTAMTWANGNWSTTLECTATPAGKVARHVLGGRMRSYQLASTHGLTPATLEPLHNSVQVQHAPSHLCTHDGMRNSMGQLCCTVCS